MIVEKHFQNGFARNNAHSLQARFPFREECGEGVVAQLEVGELHEVCAKYVGVVFVVKLEDVLQQLSAIESFVLLKHFFF